MITAMTFDDICPAYLTSLKLKTTIEFVDDLKIPCTFFIVPDNSICNASEGFVLNLEKALASKHELSLHGCMHTKNEFGVFYPPPRILYLPFPFPTLKKQTELMTIGRDRLLKLIGVRPQGFRAPYYLYNTNTLTALSSLGFKYDSSSTIFKVTHCSRLRVQWVGRYRPFMYRDIVEIPVTGDYTFNLENYGFSDSLKLAVRDFELMRSFDGVFVINNHLQKFQRREFQFLESLIRLIREKTIFLRLVDIASNLLSA